MHPRKPSWLILFLILWLPLQGFAVPLMPYCQHGHRQETAQPVWVDSHCQQPVEACCPHGTTQSVAPAQGATHGQDCDGCSLCHLATGSALLTAYLPLAGVTSSVDLPRYARFYRSYIPQQPQRPPRDAIP